MSISRVKSAGWSTNEKLTSAQMNAVDVNSTYALDKRSGQTDTLSSVITIASGGQLSFASGSSITSASGSTFTFAGAASFAGTAVNTFTSGSATTFNSGSTLTLGGTTRFATSSVLWQSSSDVTFGHVTASSGSGILTTISGQNCTGSATSGGDIVITSGSGTSVNGSIYLQVAGTNWIVANADYGFVQITKPTVLVDSSIYSAAKVVSYASSVSLDLNNSNVFVIGTLTGNISITVNNVRDGGIYTFYVTENATGGHTISFFQTSGGSTYYGSQATNLNTGANKVNIYQFLGRVVSGVPYFYCLSLTSV